MAGRRTTERVLADLPRAVELQRAGQFDKAERVYRRILKRQPAQPDALHFLGLLSHARGDLGGAIELVRRATAHAPDYFDAFNNLGNLLKLAGDFADAEAAYRRATALRPEDANARSNLGVVLKIRGNLTEAEEQLRRAIEIDNRHVPAYKNLGHLLKRLGRVKEAFGCYRMAIVCDPGHPDALWVLGLAFQANGEIEKARDVFGHWLAREPDNPVAAHMLSACAGADVPPRASDAYVRASFDSMAESFDEHLADLDYQAPRLIGQSFSRAWPVPRAGLDVLDAGCGTGLCAAWLRPHARTLVGVDLSAGMLRRAERLRQYDRLVEAELTQFLQSQQDAWDAIVSADTLCYFGALDRLFEAAARALRSGGRLLFTVEQALDPGETGYRLQPHGRYSHAQAYVASQLERAGMSVDSIVTDKLRKESGRDVAGLVVTAGRP